MPYLLNREDLPPPNTDPGRTVVFGTHIRNVYEVSRPDRSFQIEGWYWLRWPQAISAILDEQQIATTKIIEFTNLDDSSEMTLEPVQPAPSRLDNGAFLHEFRFSAGLYITDIDLHPFPFTKLSLPVIVEFRPDELACPAPNRIDCIGLRSEPSSEEGTLGQFVAINGYTIRGVWINEFLHQYPTGFGRTTTPSFASIRLDIANHAEHFAAFTTYIIQLLILVDVALFSPFLLAGAAASGLSQQPRLAVLLEHLSLLAGQRQRAASRIHPAGPTAGQAVSMAGRRHSGDVAVVDASPLKPTAAELACRPLLLRLRISLLRQLPQLLTGLSDRLLEWPSPGAPHPAKAPSCRPGPTSTSAGRRPPKWPEPRSDRPSAPRPASGASAATANTPRRRR